MIETPPFTAADGREHLTSMGTFKSSDPVAFQDMLSRVPLQRTGRPAEVATAVLFLASQLAGFINGANLAIDGGMSVTL
jgi:NAD(P)-dependent dehydrogenase (short-subunit alcohol dehydrogenase family)